MKSIFTSLLCVLLALCAVPLPVSAQSATNKGTDFWFPYTTKLGNQWFYQQVFISSDVATSGTVSIPAINYYYDFTLEANKVIGINIPIEGYVESSEVVVDKSIHVTAKDPVVVISHALSGRFSATSMVLPTPALGREYFVMTYSEQDIPEEVYYTSFTVVAAEDHTTVQITPSANTMEGKLQGKPFEITLMQGELYQVHSLDDLTGTKVSSVSIGGTDCKRIAVFAANEYIKKDCAQIINGDVVLQQLFPVTSWGSNFATAPMSVGIGGDKFRILASENNTKVTVSSGKSYTLQQGQFVEFLSGDPEFISADKLISVAQLPAFQYYCDKIITYPDLVMLNPVEQVLKEISVFSFVGSVNMDDYINVIMKTQDVNSFRSNGEPQVFTPIPGNSTYSYARFKVEKGEQHLKADAGFHAMAFGLGRLVVYAYSAGANVKNLVQHMSLDKNKYCDGEAVTYSGFAAYEPLSWLWDFGDGNTSTLPKPSHTYETPGTYTVTLTTVRDNNNECSSVDVSVAELTVYPNPEAAFTYETECLNKGIIFRDQSVLAGENSQVTGWLWDFGDGTTSTEQHPRHSYATPKVYPVKLQVTTTTGCSSTFTQQVKVDMKPVIAFDVVGACEGKTISFKDRSTSTTELITGWHWDFGDGTTSALEHPEHSYSSPATYPVTLTLTFASGCQLTLTKPVVINPTPVIKLELPDVCILDEAQFVNRSTISSGTMTYLWEFGDGKTSTEVNPRHRYTAEKEYTVRLTATSDKGCSETIEAQYIVSGAYPKADFTTDQYCQVQGVQFTDASSVPFGRIVRWEWDFGDGNTSTEQHPNHVYAKAATYQVTLKAYSGIICESIITKTITVNPEPVARFQTGNVCDGEAARFKSTSFVETGSITSYSWDFGDGKGTSTAASPQYTYAASGTYPVTLTVTTDKGCQDAETKLITVFAKPKAAFSPVLACISNEVSFRDESTITTGLIIAWNWSFGDGATSIEQHPRHRYAQAKSYKVKLEVTTTDGCKDVIEKTVVIQALPTASAGPDQLPVCGRTSTTLAANTPAVGTGTWTILNGTGGQFSDIQNPRATFSGRMGETYKLLWTVRNSPCTEAWDEVELRFGPVPIVSAGPDLEIIEGESILLQGSGEGTLLWSAAATLDNATLARPKASPTETTTYTLIATSPEGCQSTDQVTVKAFLPFFVSIT